MDQSTPFPPVPADLVEALDRLFPLRSPDPEWPDRRVWIEVGQRRVVDFLKTTLARQQAEILTDSKE